jgi:HPt (histidine-containing phosphotransfer) domain-containing protein
VHHILIVEDSRRCDRRSCRLEDIGLPMRIAASSGFEALRELPRGDYDLIVTDINMPDINGLEADLVRPPQRSLPIDSAAHHLDRGIGTRSREGLELARTCLPREALRPGGAAAARRRSCSRRPRGVAGDMAARRTQKQARTRATREFVSEVEEILDRMRADLADLADARSGGRLDPELANRLFRSAHSLKGIAGMFGFDGVSDLAHHMEDILDGLRMGRLRRCAALALARRGVEVVAGCSRAGTATRRQARWRRSTR